MGRVDNSPRHSRRRTTSPCPTSRREVVSSGGRVLPDPGLSRPATVPAITA